MTPLDLTCRKTPPRQLSRLSEVAAGYDGLIIDVWGVLHDGVAVYDDAVDALIAVRDTGKRVVLLTNSSRRADNLADMLDALGIARSLYDTIISSGEAAAAALANPAMYRRAWSSAPSRTATGYGSSRSGSLTRSRPRTSASPSGCCPKQRR